MHVILWTLLKTVGTVIGTLFMQLLTGKSFKHLLLWPIQKLSRKTKTTEDDRLVENIRKDWDLEAPNPPTEEPKP